MTNPWVSLGIFAFVVGIVASLFGYSLLAITRPGAAWYLREGWKFKGVEPSRLALLMTRLGGFFLLSGLLIVGGLLVLVHRGPPGSASPKPPSVEIRSGHEPIGRVRLDRD